ncbi:MAG TPA: hypothetical protein VIL46_03380, partial [Gemmataceae bacterium]
TRLVSGDAVDDASVRIWQVIGADGKVVAKGEPLQKFKVTPTRASAMAFSPDGKLVATAADVPFRGGRGAAIDVHIWDIATGKEVRRIEGAGDGQIRGLAFSPDGKYLAIGGSGGLGFKIATRLWDVATGKEVQSFETLADYLAFSPDGRMLAAARLLSPTVEVWEVASGQKRAEFDTRSGSVLGLAFSADGRTLASLGENTTAVLWDLTLGQRAAEPADLEATWKELSAADAAAAYRALRKLTAAGDAAVPFLAERLRPVRTADAETVRRLIARLESPRFAEREKAARELADLGSAAVPFLREALQGQLAAEARRQIERLLEEHAPEGLSPARLRQLRAVEALEQAGTPAARRLLGELAGGVPGDRLSAEAAAALRRLERPGAPR